MSSPSLLPQDSLFLQSSPLSPWRLVHPLRRLHALVTLRLRELVLVA